MPDGCCGSEVTIACTLSAGATAERARRWRALAERALLGSTREGAAVSVAYRRADGVVAELEALVLAERECCPFATWQVRESGDEARLVIGPHPGMPAAGAETVTAWALEFAAIQGAPAG